MEKRTPDYYETIEFNLSSHGQAHFEVSKVSHSYVPLHWHESVEIISVLDGELSVTADQHQYQLRAGNCIILNPFVLHSTVSVNGNTALLLHRLPEALSLKRLEEGDGVPARAVGVAFPGAAILDADAVHLPGGVVPPNPLKVIPQVLHQIREIRIFGGLHVPICEANGCVLFRF